MTSSYTVQQAKGLTEWDSIEKAIYICRVIFSYFLLFIYIYIYIYIYLLHLREGPSFTSNKIGNRWRPFCQRQHGKICSVCRTGDRWLRRYCTIFICLIFGDWIGLFFRKVYIIWPRYLTRDPVRLG
jgi:hypothetical protein